MKVVEVCNFLEEIAPLHYAEDFDNVGLLLGDPQDIVTNVLVTLDTTEDVVLEAIEKKCNLIISFHPIIFKGLKKLNGSSYVERVVIKAIRNGINIYATHTALDNSRQGVNDQIAKQLMLKNTEILVAKENTFKQLSTYVSKQSLDTITTKLLKAGARQLTNHDHFIVEEKNTETSISGSRQNSTIESLQEVKLEMIVSKKDEDSVINVLIENNPSKERNYTLISIDNKNNDVGIGLVGELEKEMTELEFFDFLKSKMNTTLVRHSKLLGKKIKRVAVLGGSGSFAIKDAIRYRADVYVTSDLKYHDYFLAENRIILADIGHFESEQFTKNLITTYLKEKFTNFVIFNSEINTNPVNYY